MKKVFLLAAVLFGANSVRSQWEPDVRLTNDPGASYTSYNNAWNIATSGDTVHAVWYDDRSGHNEIFYKRSLDAGISWSSDTQLTNNTNESQEPSIAVSGSFVHVFWYYDQNGTYEIYYKRSTDGGTTWSADTRLTNAPGDSWELSASLSGSALHVVWYDDRNGNDEIYYKRSIDGGVTWGTDTRLTNDAAYSGFPCVAVSDSAVQVVWEEDRDGLAEIYYKRSADGGITWGSDTRLTFAAAGSWDPCIAMLDSTIHVVWWDERNSGTIEIYYKRSTDGGLTWGEDKQLTNSLGDAYYPSIAVSGSFVHVAWYDTRDGNDEIYYIRSTDRGITWEADTRLTNATGWSEFSSVALSDSVVHVVWCDNRDGNPEIYYKRNPTGNPIVGTENNEKTKATLQFSIYPNPASTLINLQFTNELNLQAVNPEGKSVLTIRNILGEELLSKQIQNDESVFDVSGLQNGLYFVAITTVDKLTVSKKLIILK
jgi:hypothetical protein